MQRICYKDIEPFLDGFFNIQNFLLDIFIIYTAGLFDDPLYTIINPNVSHANINYLPYYLFHDGIDRRNSGLNSCSSWYTDTYQDVHDAGINPLLGYVVMHLRKIRL